MSGARLRAVLGARWPIVVIAVLLGAGLGTGAALSRSAEYRSTATVFVSLDRGGSATDFNAGSLFAQNLIPSYAAVATMPVVLRPVVVELDLDASPADLADRITVANPPGTALLDITVVDASPQTAADIANAVADRLQDAVASLSPRTDAGGAALRVTSTSAATPASAPASLPPQLFLVTGILAGIGLAVALVTALELLTAPVRGRRDVAPLTDAPVIGLVPHHRRAGAAPLPVVTDPSSPPAQQLLVLRAAYSCVADGAAPGVALVCSPGQGNGRTTIATNLAIALASTGRRVLLIDADLQNPSTGRLLGTSGPGLTAVLRGGASAAAAVETWSGPAPTDAVLHVIPAGADAEGSTVLLESPRMRELLAWASREYECVLVDTPPLLRSADATALARLVPDVLLVVDSRSTRRSETAEALDRLELVGSRPVAVVLNHCDEGSRYDRRRLRRTSPDPEQRAAAADATADAPVADTAGPATADPATAGPATADPVPVRPDAGTEPPAPPRPPARTNGSSPSPAADEPVGARATSEYVGEPTVRIPSPFPRVAASGRSSHPG